MKINSVGTIEFGDGWKGTTMDSLNLWITIIVINIFIIIISIVSF